MGFKTYQTNCIRCKKDIPSVNRTQSRKYCKECAYIIEKERSRDSQRKRRGIIEKPCFVCGVLTFNYRTCSPECLKKATEIDRIEYAIRNKIIIIENQRKQIKKLRGKPIIITTRDFEMNQMFGGKE